MIDQNKQLVRRLYETLTNERRFDALEEVLSGDFDNGDTTRGPAAYERAVRTLAQGFPDVKFTVEALIAEGDQVVVRWTWRGTHTGVLRGLEPTQVAVVNDGVVIYGARDGRLVRSWTLNDRLGLLQALGAVTTRVTR
jgi:predicted ester cyclase